MKALLLLPLLLAGCVSQRTYTDAHPGGIPILTEIYPTPDGSTVLELRGLFSGSDTVFVQVFHDGEELTPEREVRIYSWALTLGEYDYYDIKFTDEQGRVKYLSIHELCDGVIEYVPEIIIDFDRTGNLLLFKPSDGKPDFLQLDAGLSRRK